MNAQNRVKAVRMVRCPHCGAEYEEGLLHCPYCKSVDDYQDESEYLEDLDELRDKLEDIPEETLRQNDRMQKKQAVRDLRKIFVIVAVFFAAIGGIVLFETVMSGNTQGQVDKRNREKYLWIQENYPILDEMYEKEDYEGLLEKFMESGNAGIYDWEHYDLLTALEKISVIREGDLQLVDEAVQKYGEDSDEALRERAALFSDELQLRYLSLHAKQTEDRERIASLSEEYLKDLTERFSLTEEELAELDRLLVKNYGYMTNKECRDYLKNR